MDDIQFQKLLHHFNLSWEGCRKVRKGVKKRIRRHMQSLRSRDIKEYLDILAKNPDIRKECELLMTVATSRYFRDKRLWEEFLCKKLLEIAGRYEGTMRVWSAGCASGEEVYSLKILWKSLSLINSRQPDLHITATDMNPDYLKRAKAGVYALSSLKEIPEQRLSESFKRLPGKKQFKINPSFQKGIIWLEKNIFSDPPVGPFHIIFLRNNLLTYYKVDLTGPVINRIIGSLFPGAYLVTGSHEKLPSGFEKQLEPDSLSYVYKKIK